MSQKPNRRNGKKSLNNPPVIEVKSMKLRTRTPNTTKSSLSENDIQECGPSRQIRDMPLKSDGEDETVLNNKLLQTKNSVEELLKEKHKHADSGSGGDELRDTSYNEQAADLDAPRSDNESDNDEQDYSYSYKNYGKNSKSITFINEVTVLYFNGQNILSQSREPLKKEMEQQYRNKEMRKSKGQDSVYLF